MAQDLTAYPALYPSPRLEVEQVDWLRVADRVGGWVFRALPLILAITMMMTAHDMGHGQSRTGRDRHSLNVSSDRPFRP